MQKHSLTSAFRLLYQSAGKTKAPAAAATEAKKIYEVWQLREARELICVGCLQTRVGSEVTSEFMAKSNTRNIAGRSGYLPSSSSSLTNSTIHFSTLPVPLHSGHFFSLPFVATVPVPRQLVQGTNTRRLILL
jgi:hypothetical protein